jgi:hypothetical protein
MTKAILVLLAATLVLGTRAHAAQVDSAMLQLGNDSTATYVCMVTNLGPKAISPVVELVNLVGETFRSTQLQLPPGETFGVVGTASESPFGRCRVTGAFSPRRVAVSFSLRQGLGRTLTAVTAP